MMRRLLFAFLIVLMPLRGWAGDAMAVHMLAQSQNAKTDVASILIANNADPIWASGLNDSQSVANIPGDCPGHHELTTALTGDADGALDHPGKAHGECKTCSACQICHTVAVEPTAPAIAVLQTVHHTQPGAVSTPFASAVLAPGLKPPIS